MDVRTSEASARELREGMAQIGAIVSGRRNFDNAQAWAGNIRNLDSAPIKLDDPRVVEGVGVTHLEYRVGNSQAPTLDA